MNAQGLISVALFFVLSGYVISEALKVFYRRRLSAFFCNRFLRLFPPYCAAVLVALTTYWMLYSAGAFPREIGGLYRTVDQTGHAVLAVIDVPTSKIFDLHNIIANILVMPILYGIGAFGFFPMYAFVPQYWALNVELQFYALAGIAWWGLYVGSKGDVQRLPWQIVLVAVLTGCFLFYSANVVYHIEVFRYFRYCPYFILGVCMYFYDKNKTLSVFGLLLASAGIVFEVFHPERSRSYSATPLLIGVGFGSVIIFSLAHLRVTDRWKELDKRAGDLSYPIYVNHTTAIVLCSSLVPYQGIGVLILSLMTAVALSWLMMRMIEPALSGQRNRLRGAVV